jgi:hypothetical protein
MRQAMRGLRSCPAQEFNLLPTVQLAAIELNTLFVRAEVPVVELRQQLVTFACYSARKTKTPPLTLITLPPL